MQVRHPRRQLIIGNLRSEAAETCANDGQPSVLALFYTQHKGFLFNFTFSFFDSHARIRSVFKPKAATTSRKGNWHWPINPYGSWVIQQRASINGRTKDEGSNGAEQLSETGRELQSANQLHASTEAPEKKYVMY